MIHLLQNPIYSEPDAGALPETETLTDKSDK